MKSELVHEDSRGKIVKIKSGNTSFNLMTRKKGSLMSGDYHPHAQYDVVLKGKVKITLREDDEDKTVVKGENEFIKIPPEIPHMFEALEDCVLIEWWDGPYVQKIYKPYRKIVEEKTEK